MYTKLRKIQRYSSPKYIVVICVSLVAVCVAALLLSLLLPTAGIEDTNGPDNTNLTVITMDEILSDADEYSSYLSKSTRKGSQTNASGRLSTYDYQECSFSCKRISGVMTLQATKIPYNTLTLKCSSQLDAGNLEIVIVVDGEYYCHVPIDQIASVELTDIGSKTVVVKVAAESATLNVSVQRDVE